MEVFGAVGLICYIIFNFNIYKYSFYHSIICIIQSTTVIFYSRRELNISLKVIYTLFPYTMLLSLPLYRNFAYAAAKDSNANCFWKMYSEYKRLFCIGEIYSYVAIVLYSSRSHWSIQFACELKWWRKKKTWDRRKENTVMRCIVKRIFSLRRLLYDWKTPTSTF